MCVFLCPAMFNLTDEQPYIVIVGIAGYDRNTHYLFTAPQAAFDENLVSHLNSIDDGLGGCIAITKSHNKLVKHHFIDHLNTQDAGQGMINASCKSAVAFNHVYNTCAAQVF